MIPETGQRPSALQPTPARPSRLSAEPAVRLHNINLAVGGRMTGSNRRRRGTLLFVLLFLLALALRVWGLDRDPPSIDVLPDEAPWTDEGTLSFPTLEILRGANTLSSSATLLAGAHPLHQLALYATMRTLGTGRVEGRLLSVLAGLVGLAALTALGKVLWNQPGGLLALGLGATSFFLIVLDRSILSEAIIVPGMTLLALVGVRAHSRWSGFIVGIGLGLLAVGVKLHALALLPPFVVVYALRRRQLLIPLVVGTGVVLLLWRMLWFPTVPTYSGYLETRMTEPRMGVADPLQLAVNVILAGIPGYFFPYQIALLLLASMEVVAALLGIRRWLAEAPDIVLLGALWLPASIVGASLFKYMPARYFLPAEPALVLLAIAGIKRLWDGIPLPHASKTARLAVGIGVGFFLLFQIAPPLPIFGNWALWIPVLGLPAPPAMFWLVSQPRPGLGLSKRSRGILLATLLLFHLAFQGGLYWKGVGSARPDLPAAAATLSKGLPADAIVTGRMAGTLALLAPLRAVLWYNSIVPEMVESLSEEGPVWLAVLEGDEELVDAKVWKALKAEYVFPVEYSSQVQRLTIYRYQP